MNLQLQRILLKYLRNMTTEEVETELKSNAHKTKEAISHITKTLEALSSSEDGNGNLVSDE